MQLQQQRGRLPSPKKRAMEQLVLDEILQHRRAYRHISLIASQMHGGIFPLQGELDLEKTLELPLPRAKHQVCVHARKPASLCITILLDVSQSISPKQLFLGLLLVSIVFHIHDEVILSIFSTTATTLPNSPRSDREFLEQILYSLDSQYTNLHAGLTALQKTTNNQCDQTLALVISDCSSNYGPPIQKGDFLFPHLMITSLENHLTNTNKTIDLAPNLQRKLHSLTDIDVVLQSIQDYIETISCSREY